MPWTPGRPEPAAGAPVELVEVGPRDGLQNESVVLGPLERAELIGLLARAGLRRIEAVSFARPDRVPQMADAEKVLDAVDVPPGVSLIGLVMNERGLDRALETRVDEVNVVVVATETFSRANQGRGVREMADLAGRLVERARSGGRRASVTISAAFGCPFEGEVATEAIATLASVLSAASPDELALGDTIGVAVPSQVHATLADVAAAAPGIPLRCHFHNTRNTGYANAIAAWESGARALDASLGGFGGCPFAPRATGNVATEDLAWMLGRMGALEHEVELGALFSAAEHLGERLGHEPPALLGRAGIFPKPASEPDRAGS
jgi:hydroxymethylglutaryl-CoA lyase